MAEPGSLLIAVHTLLVHVVAPSQPGILKETLLVALLPDHQYQALPTSHALHSFFSKPPSSARQTTIAALELLHYDMSGPAASSDIACMAHPGTHAIPDPPRSADLLPVSYLPYSCTFTTRCGREGGPSSHGAIIRTLWLDSSSSIHLISPKKAM
ncbi:hypothetical protein H0G86_001982 [Trichoderma simmonsii]|uniref:Uncharacterized protein n=1 Tax=Trichoderma simmonsii TaxID=1491479 RepID=A0A8G0L7C1_9HYPO|nr:hypothetical protein H0G86_001982 [Trichoderma simmonsii]